MAKENFFDFREKQTAKSAAPATGRAEPLTVTQLTSQIERSLKESFPRTVHVKGEASNLNHHRASGHLYFTLKDAGACIDCVMFRSDAEKLKFKPTDGMEMNVGGRIAVYPQRGRYQLYASTLVPLGKGALELAFQQLCEKLRREGLFEADRKKLLPPYPMQIAIVTSRATAALQDILKVLSRYPWLKLFLYHVPVQGDGSAEKIAAAITHLNRNARELGGIDEIILARGGGSLEDLWEFNEEILARAIVASKIPIVSGIGHEVDISIADLTADYHAHTPTEAAQVVAANWKNAGERLHQLAVRAKNGWRNIVTDARHRLMSITRHEFFRRPIDRIHQQRQFLDDRQRALQLVVSRRLRSEIDQLASLQRRLSGFHPAHRVQLHSQRLTDLTGRLRASARTSLERRQAKVEALQRHLQAISPLAVLQRGYSITTHKKGGQIVRSAADVKTGERLTTRFADGTIDSVVEDQKQLPLFE